VATQRQNKSMVLKLGVITLGMFAFGYALVPLYNAICAITGINVLAVGETENSTLGRYDPKNSQIDLTREVTVEFDANSRGVWSFKPAVNALVVHPGEMATVMYEFQNTQARTLAAQAIPSYAPKVMAQYFHKVECFCFNQYTLAPGEKKQWPVVFVVDPKMPNNVTTMTLSYTFFEVGAKTPPAPKGTGVAG
jgi:cytochrome c oxidase assembly protein subunit 11